MCNKGRKFSGAQTAFAGGKDCSGASLLRSVLICPRLDKPACPPSVRRAELAAENFLPQTVKKKTNLLKLRINVLATICTIAGFISFFSPALAATAPFDETILAEVQALQELKEKQPEVYQQRISELKNNVKKDVGNWRAQQPEVYQRFMQRSQERIQHHREFLRQKRPDLYPVYQKRQEQRENNREAHRSAAPQERAHPNTEPVRPSFENHELHNSQQNPQRSFSQPSGRLTRPSSRGGLTERPRINAGNDPRARTARVENKPGFKPRQQGSFINSQERPRTRPSNSQGFSRQSRQERPKPRDSRQRS